MNLNLNNDFATSAKNSRINNVKRFQEMKEREKEEKLKRLLLKDEYLEEQKRNKMEENRLRSVIQVSNKFRISGDIYNTNSLISNKLTGSSSFIVGASQHKLKSSTRTHHGDNVKTIESRNMKTKYHNSDIL